MNYTIKDDVIVFNCEFNLELTKEHIKQISKYKTLIFSNDNNHYNNWLYAHSLK